MCSSKKGISALQLQRNLEIGGFTVTTNTVESYFSLLKRSNYGVYHHWSRKYLAQYCAEVDFRYNGCKISGDKLTIKAIKATEGKRLMLNQPQNVEWTKLGSASSISGMFQ